MNCFGCFRGRWIDLADGMDVRVRERFLGLSNWWEVVIFMEIEKTWRGKYLRPGLDILSLMFQEVLN